MELSPQEIALSSIAGYIHHSFINYILCVGKRFIIPQEWQQSVVAAYTSNLALQLQFYDENLTWRWYILVYIWNRWNKKIGMEWWSGILGWNSGIEHWNESTTYTILSGWLPTKCNTEIWIDQSYLANQTVWSIWIQSEI